MEFYKNDLNSSLLSAQLQNLGSWSTGKGERLLLIDCIKAMQEMSTAQKEFFSEVCTVARRIRVMPATNAVSFSAMRRLKTYLRSTMCQCGLNHVMLLNINQESLDKLTIDVIAKEFVRGNQHRLSQFGHLSVFDLKHFKCTIAIRIHRP